MRKHEFPVLRNDLILRAARGEPCSSLPVWIMRQAGRYLPEFRELRKEHDFFTLVRTPELACEVTLQPIRRYPGLLDAAIIFSDILVIPQALGMEVLMVDGKGPVFPKPLLQPSDIKLLKIPERIEQETAYMMDAITLTRMKLDGRVPLIGFAGAPWTLMTYMVEKDQARTWLYKFPEESHQLLSLLTTIISDFLVAQVQAGAQLLQVFDSAAGELSPGLFREFALPYLREISKNVRAGLEKLGLEQVPLIVFAKGMHSGICELADSGYDVISLDWTMDASEIRSQISDFLALSNSADFTCTRSVPSGFSSQDSCKSMVTDNSCCYDYTTGTLPVTLQGNLDPAALHAPYPILEKKIRDMIDEFGDTDRYIVNLGHGMWPSHDPEKVKFFLQTVKKISCGKCNPDDLTAL